MKSVTVQHQIDIKFINSENSKTTDLHILFLIFLDEINLHRIDKCVALSNLSIYHTWKNIKKSHKKQ